jgi:hypothetical protein
VCRKSSLVESATGKHCKGNKALIVFNVFNEPVWRKVSHFVLNFLKIVWGIILTSLGHFFPKKEKAGHEQRYGNIHVAAPFGLEYSWISRILSSA